MSTEFPRPPIRCHRRTRLANAVLVVWIVALWIAPFFQSFWTAAAWAQDLPDFMNGTSDQAQNSDQVQPADSLAQLAEAADVAECQSKRDAYERTLPVPSPTPGVSPNIGYVVQLVNESNQTLLAAADAAGLIPNLVNVLPREKTWVMAPFDPIHPEDHRNILTIDIPPKWENTICGHGSTEKAGCVGPLFWARTGCRYDVAHNLAQCETGSCSGIYDCSKAKLTSLGSRTFTEWTFRDNNKPPLSAPDISVVDGASINVDIEPIGAGFPNKAPAQFNPATWMSPENLPLTKCGEDLRAASSCPAGQFQLKRKDLGFFIKGDPGGDDVVGCFSNCGLWEFQGGTFTGPSAPCPGFRCPGTPPANCVPNGKDRCYYWRTFCCFVEAGDLTKVYSSGCNTPDQVPSPSCKQNGICWSARANENKGFAGTCSCPGVIKNPPCPPDVCTNQYSPQTKGNQPPFNTCSNVGDPSQCIGDDTIHKVMPRGLTWPNDPETYFSNARVFRVIFAPGYFVSQSAGTAVPISPSGPVPLCSSLPTAYGYASQYGGPKPVGGHPCDDSVNKKGAQFAGAIFGATQQKVWACAIGDGIDAGQDKVLCRWHPTATPTPTPKPTATKKLGSKPPTPTAIPTPGADVTSTSVSNIAAPGSTVPAGTFTVRNDLKVTETIASVTISASDPGLFSSMTLSGGGQSARVTPPTASTKFAFTTPISVPAGGSVTFSLSAVIAMNPVMLGSKITYAGLTLTDSLPITTSTWPLAGGLLILGIVLLGLPDGTRRRAFIIAVLALGVAAASAGCGGSSSGPSVVSSSQQVTTVAVTAAGAQEVVVGVPAPLGTIID